MTGQSGIFNDSSSNLPGKIFGIYALLIAANMAPWL
jgi:hypothetical protein